MNYKIFLNQNLKMNFLFFVGLSNRIHLKYDDLLNKINSILLDENNDIKNIFSLNDYDNLLNYLEENFIKYLCLDLLDILIKMLDILFIIYIICFL